MANVYEFPSSNPAPQVDFTDISFLSSEDYTVGAWLWLEDISNHFNTILNDDSVSTPLISLWRKSSGTDVIFWQEGSSKQCDLADLTPEQWIHVALVADGTDIKSYLNGSLIETESSATRANADFGRIGTRFGAADQDFSGRMGDFRAFSKALSDSEVSSWHQGSLTVASSDLVRWYKMDTLDSNVVVDSSDSEEDGTAQEINLIEDGNFPVDLQATAFELSDIALPIDYAISLERPPIIFMG